MASDDLGIASAYDGPLRGFVDAVRVLLMESGAASISMEANGALAIVATDKHALNLSIGARVEAAADDLSQPFHAMMTRLVAGIDRAPVMSDLVFTIEADGLLLYVGPTFIESHIAALLRAF